MTVKDGAILYYITDPQEYMFCKVFVNGFHLKYDSVFFNEAEPLSKFNHLKKFVLESEPEEK